MTLRLQPSQRFSHRRNFQPQPLATAADRGRKALRPVRDQDQGAAGRRLFQGFQQCIEGIAVHRLGRIHQRHLASGDLRRQHQLFTQPPYLRDQDFLAQFLGFFVDLESFFDQVRVRTRGDQRAISALAAGIAASRRAAHQPMGKTTCQCQLPQPGRTAHQQRMRQPSCIQRNDGLGVGALLPGRRHVGTHVPAPNQPSSAASSAARTCSTGCEASITRQRAGSSAARRR